MSKMYSHGLKAKTYTAQALATKVRQCNVSHARLPLHFLQPFNATFNPVSDGEGGIDRTIIPKPRSGVEDFLEGTVLAKTTSYLRNSRSTTAHLNRKYGWTSLVSVRMREALERTNGGKVRLSRKRATKQWERDPNMPNTVLEYLRADVLDALGKVLAYDYPEILVHSAQERQDERLFGYAELESPDAMPMETSEQSTASYGDQVSMYFLPELLTEEQMIQLLAHGGRIQDGLLALRHHRRTIKLHLALLKLRDYLGYQQHKATGRFKDEVDNSEHEAQEATEQIPD
jgi:hypothetical protein